MNNTQYMILLVFVMALVTYLIRMIPFVFFKKKIQSTFIKSILYYLPYAVLTAMTFPSIFYVSGNVITSTVGTVVALIGSLTKRSLVVVAILAVIAILLADRILILL